MANLCVSYVMCNLNEEVNKFALVGEVFFNTKRKIKFKAEELMRRVEKEEDRVSMNNPDEKLYHLSIINLVIGYLRTTLFS